MLSTPSGVVEQEEDTLNVFSSNVDSTGIQIIQASPNNRPLKTLKDVQTLLQQGRKQDVKLILRNNSWPVNHQIRRELWPLLCLQHNKGGTTVMGDGFYQDMVIQVFGTSDLPDKPISLPPFVETSHCQTYYLTHRGRSVADRVVSVLGYACPDIVYSPTIYPICGLLLHYMSGKSFILYIFLFESNKFCAKFSMFSRKFNDLCKILCKILIDFRNFSEF